MKMYLAMFLLIGTASLSAQTDFDKKLAERDARISELEARLGKLEEQKGDPLDEAVKEAEETAKQDSKKRYTDAMHPAYGAARLWLDAIIEPNETRDALIQAIEMSANNADLPEFKTGVLQT